MSLNSLLNVEVEREERDPQKRVVRGVTSGGKTEASEELQKRSDILIHAIPTEVLAPYTAVVGVIISTIGPGEPSRWLLRWILYGSGLVAIVLYLGIGFARRLGESRRRKFPWAGTFAALLAFAAWGLVMPGTPLSVVLEGDDLTIWTSIITVAGAFLIALMTEPIRKKANA